MKSKNMEPQNSRQYFAGCALTGLLQSSDCYGEPLLARPLEEITDLAFAYADAMLKSELKEELDTSALVGSPNIDWDETP